MCLVEFKHLIVEILDVLITKKIYMLVSVRLLSQNANELLT